MPLFFLHVYLSFKYTQSFQQSTILPAVAEVLSNYFFNAVCTCRPVKRKSLYEGVALQYIAARRDTMTTSLRCTLL
jgi:hypothetical protein